jgi:ribosomal protein L11 methyltransferase
MEKTYVQLHFAPVSPEQSAVLVALLAERGFEGFEEGEGSLSAFQSAAEYDPALPEELREWVAVPCTVTEMREENWNAAWEAGFEPVQVEDRVAIRASFHPPVAGVKYDLVITPRMSFGTGHHATTWLMVHAMTRLDFHHKSVFDFGTGTGVLAILAEKMGAEAVEAVDNDPWSISNTTDNLVENACTNVVVRQAEDARCGKSFDVILANINRNIILANISVLTAQLHRGGTLLLSGLLTADAEAIRQAAQAEGLVFREMDQRDGWICLSFTH